MVAFSILIAAVVWMIVSEVNYHEKTGENRCWFIAIIIALTTLILGAVFNNGSDAYRGEPTGETSPWDDR